MISPDRLLEDAAIRLTHALEPQGFRVIDHVPAPDGFGSRLLGYRRGSQAVRLIWDGREHRSLLQESSERLDPDPDAPHWTDVVWERYHVRQDSADRAAEIAEARAPAIGAYLPRGAA